MRGSTFGLVAIGVGAAMTPAILDIDVSGDAVGQTVLGLLAPMGTVLGLAFVVAAFGVVVALFTDSGM